MQNIADRLTERICRTKAPIVIGLDPVLARTPDVYLKEKSSDYAGAARAILEMNMDIIDAIAEYVPAVKPQIAFYEMFGHEGVRAFEQTAAYAKEKGLLVVEDGKRNDIGNTAQAYADGHLGEVFVGGSKAQSPYNVDFLTVSPFLGPESLLPFVKAAEEYDKGLFILVKTSNPGSGMIQDIKREDGRTVSESLAQLVHEYACQYRGDSGYSPIGAVVGATYPGEAGRLRRLMPYSILLVPGYGAQGGGAADVVPNFNADGLGAIVNASRSILFAYEAEYGKGCSRAEYKESVRCAAVAMQKEIYQEVFSSCPDIVY